MHHFLDAISQRASLTPDRTALIDASHTLTYSELDDRAARLAGFLSSLGIEKSDRIGALSLNRAALVELLLACARIGSILVPFNYRLSTEELSHIVRDADVSLLLHDAHHSTTAANLPGRKISLDDDIYSSPLSPTPLTPEDPWIICYTGGTTGTPKGAVLTHGSVLWNAINTITGWGLSPDDIAPVFTPLYHTGGLNVLLTPLLYLGGASVLVPSFDPDEAFDLINTHRMTYVFLVPAMFRMMMRSPRWPSERFDTVRDFVTGGAPCPLDIYEAFAAKSKRFRMGYGLTEAGPNNFHVDPGPEHHGCVGQPLPFVETRIEIDDRQCGPDEVGELLIRGPHVFSGYWRRPDETAAVLSAGWLHTGDLAVRDPSGNHSIIGRLKEMFISGGENVCPAEVEEALISHPHIDDAAVVSIPDEKWGEAGLAAIVPLEGKQLSTEDLTSYLRDRIARYKVPKRFIFLAELPKTGAGKIDKKTIAGM